MNRHAVVSTRIGELTVVVSGDALVGIYFPHHWVKPGPLGERVEASDPLIAAVIAQLSSYLEGSLQRFDLPVVLQGDSFQQQVWGLLEEIPYGETTTYGEIAAQLGLGPSAAQAVGKAVGQNPVSIVVPCHRVVGKNGSLTGYAGGLKRKQFLLELEEPVGARLF
jgi:methylated-DNA-[protein]-cysteine S-methyltransferase